MTRFEMNMDESSVPRTGTSNEQRLPINFEAVEQGLPRTRTSDEQRLPINIEAVEKGLPQTSEAFEDELPLLIDENGRTTDPYETDVVETELSRLEGGTSSPATAACLSPSVSGDVQLQLANRRDERIRVNTQSRILPQGRNLYVHWNMCRVLHIVVVTLR